MYQIFSSKNKNILNNNDNYNNNNNNNDNNNNNNNKQITIKRASIYNNWMNKT